jgi:hypothetical protein
VYGKFIGDGSGLTNVAYAVPPVLSTTTLSTNVLTASNVSTNSLSTNYGFFSTISAGLITAKFAGDGSLLTNLPGYTSISNSVNFLLTVANLSDLTISTSYGFFSTISAGSVYGKFIGDGSGLTNVAYAVPPVLSTTTLSTNVLTASNVSTNSLSTNYGFFSTISAGTVFGKHVGDGSLLTNLPTPAGYTAISNSVSFLLTVSNQSSLTISTSYGFFSTISAGSIYSKFIGDGSGLTNVAYAVPPVLSTTTLSTNVLTASNISTNSLSTNYGFFSTISAGFITAKFAGDGSLLTNLPTPAGYTAISNSVNFLLAVSNLSSVTISTSYGFFSTISAGSVYGKFFGDGSGLTGIVTTSVGALPPNLSTISLSTNLITASNISTNSMSTNYGFFSTISAGLITAKFAGDGSLLTNLSLSLPPNLSTLWLSTGLLTASNISTTAISTLTGTASSFLINNLTTSTTFGLLGIFSTVSTTQLIVSSIVVNSLLIGGNLGYVNMGDIVTTSLSTLLIYAGAVNATGAVVSTLSTSYGYFSTISAGLIYGKFAGDGSLLTGLPAGISVVPPFLSTTTLSTGLLTASNVSTNSLSTNYGFFSTISAGSIYSKFIGDGSSLTNVSYAVPPVLSTTTLSTNVLTASNVSTNSLSTNYGFFSTISSGLITSKFAGDGSLLTNLPTPAGYTAISNSVNFLLTVTNLSDLTISTSYGFFSTISAGSIYSKFIGDGSGLTNVAYAVPPILSTTTLSTNVLTASNVSTNSLSTNYGFFSTISAGTIFGKHVGDGSLLTNVPFVVPAVLSTTTLSTNLLTASNISTNALSTNYGFFSTISSGIVFGKFVGDGSGLTGISGTGSFSVPPVLSTTVLSTGILTASNISATYISANTTFALLGVFSSISASQWYVSSLTVDSLFIGSNTGYINMGDVIATSLSTSLLNAGFVNTQGLSSISLSTNYGFFSTISSGTIYGKFVGDASLLTNLPTSGISVVPPFLSTTTLSTNLLTASNISTNGLSTNYGFFSTLSSGLLQGKHTGDGSGLFNLTTSSLSLSSGNISISTITLVDSINNSTGTLTEKNSLLYFNAFVVGGAYSWASQLIKG